MRTTVSRLLLGCGIAAASIGAASACQYHQATAGIDQTPPAQVAQTDASAPPTAPIVQPGAPAEPAGQTHTD